MNAKLANHEIVTVAVFLLGGDTKYIDTEDVAIKANAIAPGRFTWTKYPDQINIDTVRKRLWDGKKPEKGEYLVGSEQQGWMLTEKGQAFAKQQASKLRKVDLTRTRRSTKERGWLNREHGRLLSTEAFEKYKRGDAAAITNEDVQRFFRLTNYVFGKARTERIGRIVNFFSSDPDLGQLVQELAKKLEGGGANVSKE